MTAHKLARTSNRFEPSDQSLALNDLLSTAEVATLLGIKPDTLRDRARRRGIVGMHGRGSRHYWTRQQVEQLRRPS